MRVIVLGCALLTSGCHVLTGVGDYDKTFDGDGGAASVGGGGSGAGGATTEQGGGGAGGSEGGAGGQGGAIAPCTEIGGTITGLRGDLSIRNEAQDVLQVALDGSYVYDCLPEGSTYALELIVGSPLQTCKVSGPTGLVGSEPVTDLDVTCDTDFAFKASDGVYGRELWVYEGLNTLQRITDLDPTGDSLGPWTLHSVAVNNVLVFHGTDGVSGHELWRTDTTAEGTTTIKDLVPGAGDSFFLDITYFQGWAYFLRGLSNGTVLGRTDGYAVVDDIVQNAGSLFEWQDKLFMRGECGSDQGVELCSYDGVQLELVADINPGSGDSDPGSFFPWQGKLYFSADSGAGDELWVTDGTTPGTERVHEIHPGPGHANITAFAAAGSHLVFFANDGSHGHELWRSDGTPQGTELLMDAWPGPDSGVYGFEKLVTAGGKAFYPAENGTSDTEPWVSDGTPEGTLMIGDFSSHFMGSNPRDYFVANDQVFFSLDASPGNDRRQLWTSDGTLSGTALFFDFYTPDESHSPRPIGRTNERIYLRATTNQYGSELWGMDLTDDPPSIQLLANICSGSCSGL